MAATASMTLGEGQTESPPAPEPLEPLTLDRMLAPLAGYLSEELADAGRPQDLRFLNRWIAACAVYPVSRFPVTLALGKALARRDGQAEPDEFLHLLLGRLRWFRDGRMPAELRQPLAAVIDDGDRAAIRDALVTLILKALDAPPPADPRALAWLGRTI